MFTLIFAFIFVGALLYVVIVPMIVIIMAIYKEAQNKLREDQDLGTMDF